AITAVLSNSAGLAVLLLLPFLIGLRSVRAGLLAALLTVVLLGLYLSGLEIGSSGNSSRRVFFEATNEGALDQLKFTLIAQIRWAARIFVNTLDCLGSPLSIHYPIFAGIVVSLSFLLLLAGVQNLLANRLQKNYWHNPWFEMVLALAILSIAVAVLISISRLGWSPVGNRYQTLVMFYWLCVCCVTLDFGIRLGKNSDLLRLASQILCVVIAALFLTDTSRSLRPASLIYEAVNKSVALAALGVNDTDSAQTIIPKSAAHNMSEFNLHSKRTNTGYWHDRIQRMDFEDTIKCPQIRLGIQSSEFSDISFVHAIIDDNWSKMYREIPITTRRGDVLGFLTPNYSAGVTPLSLITGQDDLWVTYIPSGNYQVDEITEIVLHYRTSLFSRKPCLIKYRHKSRPLPRSAGP
ncbi:MAG: hypothetical protein ACR2QW_01675, partial [bacterium]